MHSEIRIRVEKGIVEKVFPGCVIGLIRPPRGYEVMPFGRLTYEANSPEVKKDTMYDMASVTKSIPVASLALMFIAEGKLGLSDSVKEYLPELENDHSAMIEDLLRYRVSGLQMSQLNYRTFEEVRTRVLEHGFDGPPNDKAAYSNAPAYLLGIILERVGGAILPALANKYFFEPLEMSDTTFFPNIGVYETPTIAPTEIQEGKEIRGVVHDESARIFSQARRAVGHAGLFSTALDTLKFLEALLTGKYSAVAEGAEKGLGWQLEQEWFMGAHFSKGAFGKTGFTGTSVLVDRAKGIGLVILSNRCYPKRPADAASLASAINIFRKDIADIVLS